MGTLTDSLPKPLLMVGGKTLIEHVLDALPVSITDCVVVTGYRSGDIVSFLGTNYKGRPLSYTRQKHMGTGGALCSAKESLANENLFLVVGADDIFGTGELDKLLGKTASYGITFGTPKMHSPYGIRFDENGYLTGWHDNVPAATPRFYGVGAYVLPPKVFAESFHRLGNGEYSIPHSLPRQPFPVKTCLMEQWLPVNTPEDIANAEGVLGRQDWGTNSTARNQ